MGKWGCWLAVAVHVVVRGKEAMVSRACANLYSAMHLLVRTSNDSILTKHIGASVEYPSKLATTSL